MSLTDEQFNKLLTMLLGRYWDSESHPNPNFLIRTLVVAMKALVDATGQAGEKALEKYCNDHRLVMDDYELWSRDSG